MEAYRDLKKETFLTHEGYANPQGPGDHVIDGTKGIGGVVLRCSGSVQVPLVNNSIGEETLTLTAAMNTETGWFCVQERYVPFGHVIINGVVFFY